MGLVFGCFDLVVTPEDEYVFLEVNQMGQFLFVERFCGLPLLDAFSEFLLQADADFSWRSDRVTARWKGAFTEEIGAATRSAADRHVTVPNLFYEERESRRYLLGRPTSAVISSSNSRWTNRWICSPRQRLQLLPDAPRLHT